MSDEQAIRSCDNSDEPLTPDSPSGDCVLGPSASVRHPTGSQDTARKGGNGPVSFATYEHIIAQESILFGLLSYSRKPREEKSTMPCLSFEKYRKNTSKSCGT